MSFSLCQEDEEAGILEQLRSQICYNLGLYAQKYDEEFGAYMQTFVKDVWELLVKTGIQTKYDAVCMRVTSKFSAHFDSDSIFYEQIFFHLISL